MAKIDLTLLKSLTQELEKSLKIAEEVGKAEDQENDHKHIVELSRALGIASIITQEGGMLVLDITANIKKMQQVTPAGAKSDLLAQLLGTLKAPNTN